LAIVVVQIENYNQKVYLGKSTMTCISTFNRQQPHSFKQAPTTMAGGGKSRWADDEEDAAIELQRKREKEEKKRAKVEKQRKLEEAAARQRQEELSFQAAAQAPEPHSEDAELSPRPFKRRRLSPEPSNYAQELPPAKLLRFPSPEWKRCGSVEDYEKLNDIEEGAYGWVSRAKHAVTGKVVALKRLKMENVQDGIPVTGLREIQTLAACDHPNIVRLQEVVVGEETSKIEK
jgi:cell division cycle 2-like